MVVSVFKLDKICISTQSLLNLNAIFVFLLAEIATPYTSYHYHIYFHALIILQHIYSVNSLVVLINLMKTGIG